MTDSSQTANTLKALQTQGITYLDAIPEMRKGPVVLTYDIAANPLVEDAADIFAVGATLSQGDKVLATFEACVPENEGFSRTPRHPRDKLPELASADHLQEAFALFLLWGWKNTWDIYPSLKGTEGKPPDYDALFTRGYFLLVHRGGEKEHLEHQFLRQVKRFLDHDTVGQFFEDPRTIVTLPPMALHAMTSLLWGMGYKLDTCGEVTREVSPTSPLAQAKKLTTLLWAARKKDPKLDSFRLLR